MSPSSTVGCALGLPALRRLPRACGSAASPDLYAALADDPPDHVITL